MGIKCAICEEEKDADYFCERCSSIGGHYEYVKEQKSEGGDRRTEVWKDAGMTCRDCCICRLLENFVIRVKEKNDVTS